MILPRRVVDMAGSRLGHVTVLQYSGTGGRNRMARWRVACDCGASWVTSAGSLRSGDVRSCGRVGCPHRASRRHGHARVAGRTSPEYRAWRGMKVRCLNPRARPYPDYGGRGITVCARWQESFEAFLADVGPRPSAAHSLDRIDNAGHYEPGNVRWATPYEQAENRRRTVRIAWRGTTRTLAGWARALGVPLSRLQRRHQAGWPAERMFTTPARKATVLTWGGQTKALDQWAVALGVPFERLWSRYRRGLSAEQILSPTRRASGPSAKARQLDLF